MSQFKTLSIPHHFPIAKNRAHPLIWLLVILIIFSGFIFYQLEKEVSSPQRASRMVQKDSGQYLDIAKEFATGDFSMSWMRERPHRQPLYPLLLAGALRVGRGDLFVLGAVNVLLSMAAMLVLYYGTRRLFGSMLVSLLVSVAFAINSFILELSIRLMTEPLHILCLLVALFAFLRFIEAHRRGWLMAAFAATGLDYLTRPNGLFLMTAMLGTCAVWEIVSWRKSDPKSQIPQRRAWRVSITSYLLAVMVFVVLTIPSWLPRLERYHDPIYHGYLSNFMWVDTYDKAHTGSPRAIYHLADYASSHTGVDAAKRVLHGAWQVLVKVPLRSEKIDVLYFFAVFGLGLGFYRRDARFALLTLLGFTQLLPLIWTNLSNPNLRVPYAAILPFELIFGAYALAWWTNRKNLGALKRRLNFKSRLPAG